MKNKNNLDYIFECNKCMHQLYVEKSKVQKLIDLDCPECGEEFPTFTLSGEGNFNKR